MNLIGTFLVGPHFYPYIEIEIAEELFFLVLAAEKSVYIEGLLVVVRSEFALVVGVVVFLIVGHGPLYYIFYGVLVLVLLGPNHEDEIVNFSGEESAFEEQGGNVSALGLDVDRRRLEVVADDVKLYVIVK